MASVIQCLTLACLQGGWAFEQALHAAFLFFWGLASEDVFINDGLWFKSPEDPVKEGTRTKQNTRIIGENELGMYVYIIL